MVKLTWSAIYSKIKYYVLHINWISHFNIFMPIQLEQKKNLVIRTCHQHQLHGGLLKIRQYRQSLP